VVHFCSRARSPIAAALVVILVAAGVIVGPLSSVATARVAEISHPVPLSASGCNDSVCIDLEGSGSQVSDWETTAWAGSATCTYADYWANYVLERQGTRQCVQAGTELESNWDNTSWPNGTVLCNTWPGISGEPCETIEG
jgi:hypothetical protein